MGNPEMAQFNSGEANWLPKVKQRLALAGSNVSQLCKTAGVSRQAWEKWKKSPTIIQADSLEKILKALNTIEANKFQAAPKPEERKQDLLRQI